MLKDDELAEAAERDWRSAGLGDRRTAILAYAVKLTLEPRTMGPGDVQSLRDVGLADADILGLCECVAYYAYVNRIADGLGVQLEATED